ncbi:MAG: glycosyltransferase family 4 protein [Candidatus Krumholzibacteriota bacterium]|nr:glycosyltransferase family 4 protein [Candidatus Krumholzibacteriota bacterium]
MKEEGFRLFVPHSFLPVEGGAQRYLYDICSSMDPENLVVFAPPPEDEEKCRIFDQAQAMEIVRIEACRSRWSMPGALVRAYFIFKSHHSSRLFRNFFRLCKFLILSLSYRSLALGVTSVLRAITARMGGEKIDIIHDGYILPSGLASYALHCFFGIPYVLYTYAKELYVWEEDVVCRSLMKEMLHRASAVVTISDFTRRKLMDLGVKEERIFMLPPVVSIPRLRSSAEGDVNGLRRRYGIGRQKVLLTISHLVERKGQDMVIRALPRVLEKYPDTLYLIGGRGEREDYLKRSVRQLGLENKILFIGLVTEEDISLHYRMCDIFIMTSRRIGNDMEGFGIVYLEAGYWEKPVIAGRSGGVEDAVVDGVTGLLVDPWSEAEIAAAICSLLGDGERARRLGVAARERVIGEFTFDPGERIDDLTRRVLRGER